MGAMWSAESCEVILRVMHLLQALQSLIGFATHVLTQLSSHALGSKGANGNEAASVEKHAVIEACVRTSYPHSGVRTCMLVKDSDAAAGAAKANKAQRMAISGQARLFARYRIILTGQKKLHAPVHCVSQPTNNSRKVAFSVFYMVIKWHQPGMYASCNATYRRRPMDENMDSLQLLMMSQGCRGRRW